MNGKVHQHVATCVLHVVDASESYRTCFQSLVGGDESLAFHKSASAALRRARQGADGVWFVSINLPDLPGPQLIEMLAGLAGDKLIVAVGNDYSAEDETAALSSGACQYFVKPLAKPLCRAVIEAHKRDGTLPADIVSS